MSEIYEYKTENGLFKWNTPLKPRTSSGKLGEITINDQLVAKEMSEIQRLQENKTELKAKVENFLKNINNVVMTTDKESFERFTLSIFGITREDINADTTPKLETNGIIKHFIALYQKQIKDNNIKDINVIKESINKNVEDTTARPIIFDAVTKDLKHEIKLF